MPDMTAGKNHELTLYLIIFALGYIEMSQFLLTDFWLLKILFAY